MHSVLLDNYRIKAPWGQSNLKSFGAAAMPISDAS